ncbi:MAG: DUF2256 domain-containing protein [Gammaproteobacteria bacterium]|nr:DUF2256 domain-containing protein [Gammaproteobacteria bacterium]
MEPGYTGQLHGHFRTGSELKVTLTSTHRGNKQSLPSKPCEACGRPMSWRKRWARTWEEVKFCSDACRRARGAGCRT